MRIFRPLLAFLVAAAIPGIPTAYACHRLTTWRHFHVVEDRRLYRSGQLTPTALDQVIRDHGIKTVICLRNLAREGDTELKDAEERWCAERGINYVRLTPAAWDSPAGRQNLDRFLHIIDDRARGPVLIHCFAGLHRTGVYCAVYRMERQGWTNDEAIEEMFEIGYFQKDPTALAFLRDYVPIRAAHEAERSKRPGVTGLR
ncbi:MAG TPA: tyrosine-protein phosphatase, partial [Gemmataceae bacterium]|nr:tyrosine-protein phosphatase [Gemmataceae bacterium]